MAKRRCASASPLRNRSSSPASSKGGSLSTTPRRSFGGNRVFSASQPSTLEYFGLRISGEQRLQGRVVLRMQLVAMFVAAAQQPSCDQRAAGVRRNGVGCRSFSPRTTPR